MTMPLRLDQLLRPLRLLVCVELAQHWHWTDLLLLLLEVLLLQLLL